jgi:hypothetical protein
MHARETSTRHSSTARLHSLIQTHCCCRSCRWGPTARAALAGVGGVRAGVLAAAASLAAALVPDGQAAVGGVGRRRVQEAAPLAGQALPVPLVLPFAGRVGRAGDAWRRGRRGGACIRRAKTSADRALQPAAGKRGWRRAPGPHPTWKHPVDAGKLVAVAAETPTLVPHLQVAATAAKAAGAGRGGAGAQAGPAGRQALVVPAVLPDARTALGAGNACTVKAGARCQSSPRQHEPVCHWPATSPLSVPAIGSPGNGASAH